uniref:Uncharacterized protein n=1 Tax=Eptatretus burgeri TaxID=7764 RepID=A0A8C4Q898_EPTBU
MDPGIYASLINGTTASASPGIHRTRLSWASESCTNQLWVDRHTRRWLEITSILFWCKTLKSVKITLCRCQPPYPSGSSAPLKTRTATRDMEISDLIATNLDTTSFCVEWQMHRDASSYQVTLDALRGEQPKKEFRVARGTNTHCMRNLLPGVEYKLSVQGLYRGAEGPMRSILQSTNYVIDPHLLSDPEPTLPPVIPGCYRAKADLVFMLDGSWSMGEENFKTVLQFVHSLVESFEIIGPSGVQVAVAQFSDVPRTEFLLKQYTERENLLDAIDNIDYMGGNTKTGRALKLVRSELLAPGSGTRTALPKAVIVITDGRSKDRVDKISEELQRSGHSVFAVGIDSADVTELAVIASRPVDNHVFFVGEFDELRKIAVRIADSICQVASATCPSVYLYGFTVSGFKMMEAFGLTDKTYSQHSGVSMVPGSMNVFTAYLLHPGSKLEQLTRNIHAEGLPDDFTLSFLLRVRPDASHTPIAVWQILGSDNKPQVGVVLDGSKRTLEFFGLDDDNSLQTISFSGPGVEKIFFGSFHKVHVAVTSKQVTLFVDCGLIEKKACQPLGRIDVTGREVLGQHPGSNSLGGSAASLELQMLDIVCSADWGIRDKCCELPALRVEMSCPSLPHACSCAQDSKGPPGPAGPPGATGNKGPRGSVGLPGQQGAQGLRGETGPRGAFGSRGPRGPNGFSITGPPGAQGEKGEKGIAGPPGMMGPVGPQGAMGRQGTEGPRGKAGKDGSQGVVGPPGPVGPQGPAGTDGPGGKPGPRGPTGDPGNLGLKGDKGERGDAQGQRFVRDIARQVCEQLINAQVSRFNNILAQLPRLKVGQASAGPPGEPGREGPRGMRGEAGGRGRPGFPGPPGLPGRKGEKGVGGEKGEKGASGVGSVGPPGIQGPQRCNRYRAARKPRRGWVARSPWSRRSSWYSRTSGYPRDQWLL